VSDGPVPGSPLPARPSPYDHETGLPVAYSHVSFSPVSGSLEPCRWYVVIMCHFGRKVVLFSMYISRVFVYCVPLPSLRGLHTLLCHPRWQPT
jgi:hypothetical protein